MAFDATFLLAGVMAGACGAAALAAWRGAKLRARIERLECEIETHHDAVWEAHELEERTRAAGEQALEKAEARAAAGGRAKSTFLATVTHEMRTPLTGVIGTTDLLLETALAPDQLTYARAVKQSAEAMLSLVDEILDFSRIEADRLVLQEAGFSVSGLVEGVTELLAPRTQAKGLDLAARVGLDVPAELVGDAGRVRQILLNLAGNAIKFTERGGVGIEVEMAGETVRFTVRDTGPGFAPEDAERLFEEFEQASDHAVVGAGLGLTISRKLARAMNGSLSAAAVPGAGATFTLELPLASAAGAPQDSEPAPLAGRRIVVVSDTPFGGPWLVERLKEWGAEASLLAPNSDLETAAATADTVLIDRAGALQVAELAAAARRGGASRILLLLSLAERRELPTLSADGFDGYLVKPIRAASLISRLDDPRAEQADRQPLRSVSFPAGTGLKVLLAEDDPVSALIALSHLARLGHSTVHVADGLAACEAFEAERFDAVLLDIRMPKLDGCAAARRMRMIEAARDGEPALLLAVTANAAAEDRATAIGAGMDEVLGKPFERKALETILAPLSARDAKVA